MYQSPIWELGRIKISFVGEIDKWTAVSPDRFTGFDMNEERVYVNMQGTPNELVSYRLIIQMTDDPRKFQYHLQFLSIWNVIIINKFLEPKILDHACVIPDSGKTTAVLILVEEEKGLPKIYCQEMWKLEKDSKVRTITPDWPDF